MVDAQFKPIPASWSPLCRQDTNLGGYSEIEFHRGMIFDEVRNGAYARAMEGCETSC
jgi:hypothetical protein